METLRRLRRTAAFALVLMLMLALSVPAFAASTGSVTVNIPADDVQYSIYLVGALVDNEYKLTGSFAKYKIDISEKTAAVTLANQMLADKPTPLATGTTKNGSVTFSGLDDGVYFIVGAPHIVGSKKYTPAPSFAVLPMPESSTPQKVTISGKYTVTEIPDNKISISALKVWNDNNSRTRPTYVDVKLYMDGTVIDRVRLNKNNNWRYTWTGLDPKANYAVVEDDVPADYTVSVTERGYSYIITNTKRQPPPPPPGPRLPQTGQLWWPVYVMAVSGTVFLAFGLIRRRKSGRSA